MVITALNAFQDTKKKSHGFWII